MSICLCGAEAGYPHAPDCPYPLFRGSGQQENEWSAARQALLSGPGCPHEWHEYGTHAHLDGTTTSIVACQLCGLERK